VAFINFVLTLKRSSTICAKIMYDRDYNSYHHI
jgi:hypothetical protein